MRNPCDSHVDGEVTPFGFDSFISYGAFLSPHPADILDFSPNSETRFPGNGNQVDHETGTTTDLPSDGLASALVSSLLLLQQRHSAYRC